MKKIFSVNSEYNDVRFDKWFKKNVYNVPQSFIEKNLRKGKIKINNKKIKSSQKVKTNDEVILYDITLKFKSIQKRNEKYKPTKKDLLYSSSMFLENNDNYVVINKPAGISVQSGTKSKRNILDILKGTKEFNDQIPHSVHRIDKDTSGILIVAKNREYAQLFTSLFRIRKIHKTYLGIVKGQLDKPKGTLVDEIFHYEGTKKIKTKAITDYSVINSNNNYSLLKLNPITGRKHQLRKQLLIRGHPILGDSKYNLYNLKVKKKSFLMLHAYKINFSIKGTKYKYFADPPLVFKQTLKEKYLKTYF